MLEAVMSTSYSPEQGEAVWHESHMEAEFPEGTVVTITEKKALPVVIINNDGERIPIGNGRLQRCVLTDISKESLDEDGAKRYDHVILMTRFARRYTIQILDEEATAAAREKAEAANSAARVNGAVPPYTLQEISALRIFKNVKMELFEDQKVFQKILDDVDATLRPASISEDLYPQGATIAAGHLRLASWLSGKKVKSIYEDNNGLGYDVVNLYATKPSDKVTHYKALQHFALESE